MRGGVAGQSVMSVRDIMTTPVHTIDMDDSILSAKRLFDRKRFHHAVVLAQGRVHGAVSDRDILKTISPFVGKIMERTQDLGTLKRRIHQVMSRAPVTIGPDEPVGAAADKMLCERVSCLPVVDADGSLVGIVTTRDVVKWAAGNAWVEYHPREP